MRTRYYFWGSFLVATGIQIVILRVELPGNLRWLLRIVSTVYWPVSWLTENFIHARSEADVMAGIVFLPPVVLLYSLVFAGVVVLAKRNCEA